MKGKQKNQDAPQQTVDTIRQMLEVLYQVSELSDQAINAIMEIDPDDIENILRDSLVKLRENVTNTVLELEKIESEIKSKYPDIITKASKAIFDTVLRDISSKYNTAVDDVNKRGEYIKLNSPLRIGIVINNKIPNSPPIFRAMPYGELMALPLEGSPFYAVTPCFSLANLLSQVAAAMQQVFQNYDPNRGYTNAKIRRPAIFQLGTAKDEWILKEKGALDS